MAIRERWQLTDGQIAALEYNLDMSWFHKDEGVLYYDITFILVQMAPADDNTVADYAMPWMASTCDHRHGYHRLNWQYYRMS